MRVVMSSISSIVGAVVRVVPGPVRRRRAWTGRCCPWGRGWVGACGPPGHRPAGAAVVEDGQHLARRPRAAAGAGWSGRRPGARSLSSKPTMPKSRPGVRPRSRSTIQAPIASVSEAHATAPPGPDRVDDGCRRPPRPGRRPAGRWPASPGGRPPASAAAPQPSGPPLVAHGRPRRPAEEADPVVAGPEQVLDGRGHPGAAVDVDPPGERRGRPRCGRTPRTGCRGPAATPGRGSSWRVSVRMKRVDEVAGHEVLVGRDRPVVLGRREGHQVGVALARGDRSARRGSCRGCCRGAGRRGS